MPQQAIMYTLPALIEAHPAQRADLVTWYADALARGIWNEHSRRLHAAIEAEHRGVQVLSALGPALTRLFVDLRAWDARNTPARSWWPA